MSINDWSTNPANNTLVGAIDWSENMLPSQVNDSARNMMSDVASWRDYLLGSTSPFALLASSPAFTGSVTAANMAVNPGGIVSVNASASLGGVRLSSGDSTRAGIIEFFPPSVSPMRLGYIGFGQTGLHIAYNNTQNGGHLFDGGVLNSIGGLQANGNPVLTTASSVNASTLQGLAASAFAQMSQFSGSFGSNGYINLPGGLIIQWVNVSTSAGGASSFSWPTPFPNNLFVAVPGARQGLNFSGSFSAYGLNINQFGGTVFGNNGSGASGTVSIIAIGN